MNRGAIRPVCLSNVCDGHAVITHRPYCPHPYVVCRIAPNQRRSFAHRALILQLRCFLSIRVFQNYWNGPYPATAEGLQDNWIMARACRGSTSANVEEQ